MEEKMFVAPGAYVQGFGLLAKTEYLTTFGQTGLLVTDHYVYELYGKRLQELLQSKNLKVIPFLTDQATEPDFAALDFVIAFGGGKAIDQGKSLALRQGLACIVIPTAASTDAATSRISVEYEVNGKFSHYQAYPKSPDLVLVDTALLIQSPVHFLSSGIADGLSTFIEARTVFENEGRNTLNRRPTLAALALAEKCRDVLFADGAEALAANRDGNVNSAFERVVEATTLLSGLGFESGGLSIAHALHNALLSLWSDEIDASHGQIIAVTTLIHLATEHRTPEEYHRYAVFFKELGLPTTLGELGLPVKSEAELNELCQLAFAKEDGVKKSNLVITTEQLLAALKAHQ